MKEARRSSPLTAVGAVLFFGGIAAAALPGSPGSPWVRVGLASIALGVVLAVLGRLRR